MPQRCDVCGQRIRRRDADETRYWLGPEGKLLQAHPACSEGAGGDWHASPREKVQELLNVAIHARGEGTDEARAAVVIATVASGVEDVEGAVSRLLDTSEEEFREFAEYLIHCVDPGAEVHWT
jgi:hypothetical protein